MPDEKRHAHVDLTNVMQLIVDTEGPEGMSMELAAKGGELIQKILGDHADVIQMEDVIHTPDEVFFAAINVAQGEGDAARAVGEEMDPEAFKRRTNTILNMRAMPDETIAGEFI